MQNKFETKDAGGPSVMKVIGRIFVVLLITILIAAVSTRTSHAQPACDPALQAVFADVRSIADVTSDRAVVRDRVRDFLRGTPDIPWFIKSTRNGDVPVVLLNATTYPLLLPLIERSMGHMFAQQIGYRNDHGLMRVGNYVIDADLPGHRGYGELHATGLSWKALDSYLARRTKSSYVQIETAYLVPKADRLDLEYYQRARRAAIFRIPFSFGNYQRVNHPNTLERSGENCFGFCKGSSVRSNITEISGALSRMGVVDVEKMMADPRVVAYLSRARQEIMRANLEDGTWLTWSMVNGPGALEILGDVVPANLTGHDKQIFINWIVALDASKAYAKLQDKYRISSDGGLADLQNGTNSVVLIYDGQNRAEDFRQATYASPGIFYNWDATNQKR